MLCRISSEFLITKINQAKMSSDILRTQIVKSIIYMEALTTLIKTKSKNVASVELSQISAKVENHIKKNFCHQEHNKL